MLLSSCTHTHTKACMHTRVMYTHPNIHNYVAQTDKLNSLLGKPIAEFRLIFYIGCFFLLCSHFLAFIWVTSANCTEVSNKQFFDYNRVMAKLSSKKSEVDGVQLGSNLP